MNRRNIILRKLQIDVEIRIVRKQILLLPKTMRYNLFLVIVDYQKEIIQLDNLYRELLLVDIRAELKQLIGGLK